MIGFLGEVDEHLRCRLLFINFSFQGYRALVQSYFGKIIRLLGLLGLCSQILGDKGERNTQLLNRLLNC